MNWPFVLTHRAFRYHIMFKRRFWATIWNSLIYFFYQCELNDDCLTFCWVLIGPGITLLLIWSLIRVSKTIDINKMTMSFRENNSNIKSSMYSNWTIFSILSNILDTNYSSVRIYGGFYIRVFIIFDFKIIFKRYCLICNITKQFPFLNNP